MNDKKIDINEYSKNFPNSEKYGKTCISLPVHQKITEKEIIFISNAIKKYLN